jgi:hypothetical protein
MAVVLVVWVGVIAIVAACRVLDRSPILRHWFLTVFRPFFFDRWADVGVVGFVLSALAALYLMLVIHELGHVVAGMCVGFRFRSLRVGPLVFDRQFPVSRYRGPGALVNGVAELIPASTDELAWRGVAMVAGGPVANVLSALVVLAFPFTILSALFLAASIVNAVNDLLPFEGRLGVSDGRRIGMLARHSPRGARWLALPHLGGELNDGVLPESLSTAVLAKAVEVCDASSDTVKSHAFIFASAFHRHRDDEAARRLETCLAYSGQAMPALREALMSEAAVFQARRRKRADLADQWLADIPALTQHPWFGSRAEAAILDAGGDTDGAMGKLADVEASLLKSPNNAHREAARMLLLRWRSDLTR